MTAILIIIILVLLTVIIGGFVWFVNMVSNLWS